MNPRSVMAANARKSRTTLLRAAYYFFLTSGVVVLLYVGYVFMDAYHYQAREQIAFELPRIKSVSQREGPRLIAEGGVIGELEVPRLGLKVIVAQGDSAGILRRAVGHIRETALPGQSGNVALTGHRDTVFRPLRNIRLGDAITFKTAAGDFRYQVESTAVVPPSDVSVLQPSSEPTITLITCFPFYYVGAAPNRFIVRARQVSVLPDQFGQH
jgi:LPXTG-site transpeptidase (sortase) family protein